MPVVIQPVYISGDGRASESLELEAISRISDMLRNRTETLAELRQLQIIDKSEIPENDEVTAAYKTIYAKTKLGSQNEWLARYAYVYPGLEIGTENGSPETSHIIMRLKNMQR